MAPYSCYGAATRSTRHAVEAARRMKPYRKPYRMRRRTPVTVLHRGRSRSRATRTATWRAAAVGWLKITWARDTARTVPRDDKQGEGQLPLVGATWPVRGALRR